MLKNLVHLQKDYFNQINSPLKTDINFRIELLKNLKQTLLKYEDKICKAINEDLKRNEFLSFTVEFSSIMLELNFIIKNLKKWTKRKKEKTAIIFSPSKSFVEYCPFGTVLVISPFNYPFLLALSPIISAIAAGNCVILKPSEYTESSSKLLKEILNEALPKECCEVVLGDYTKVNELIDLKMDFIFFTGSTTVGKIISQNAAKTLTPVALELGGKSPCILDKYANLEVATKRITWGKTLNAGQTCISPDYLLIEESIVNDFIEYFKKYIKEFYSDSPLKSEFFMPVINEKSFNRVISYLENQNIVFGGKYDKDTLKIEPTLVLNPSLDSLIMQEELFAPVLPIITYKSKDDIYKIIKRNEKPLAIYIFSENESFQNELIKNISFGGCSINDTILHTANFHLPFGGIGDSGMGSYHGKYSFELFSHKKGIFKSKFNPDSKLKYAPFVDTNFLKKFMHFLMK